MAAVDGTIRIDTRIDERDFNKGISGIARSLGNLGKSLGNFKQVTGTLSAMNKAISKTSQFSGMTKTMMTLRNVMTMAGAGAKVLVAALGVVASVIGTIAIAAVALGAAVVGMAAAGYYWLENYTNKLAESMSSTSYMYNEVKGLQQAFVDVRETAKTMFTPLLIAAMPILTKITNFLIRMFNIIQMVIAALLGQKTVMQYVAGSASEAADATGGVADSAKDAAKATGGMAKNTKKAGEAAEGALAAFDELNVLQMEKEQPDTGAGGYDPGVGGLGGGGIGGGGLGSFVEVPIEETILEKIENIKKWFSDAWDFIVEKTTIAWNWIKTIATGAWNGIVTAATWAWETILKPVWEWISTAATNAWNWLKENVFGPIGEKLVWLGGVFAECGQAIYTTFIAPVVKWFNEEFLPFFRDTLAPLFGKIWTGIVNTLKGVWSGLVTFFTTIWNWISTAFTNLWNLVVNIFKNIALAVSGAIQGMITVIGGIVQFITGVFTKNWKLAWEGVKNIFSGIWETIKSLSKGFVNSIIDIINFMIRSVVAGLNAVIRVLNKFKFTVPSWVPEIGGETIGFNIAEITAPQIPHLATGAVIPPNAEFLATLGDQRHGRNIEAPEDLIRQIVREEGGGGQAVTINFAGNMGALVRAMKPYVDKENTRIGRSLVKGSTA